MKFASINPICCDEVLKRYVSKAVYSLLINEFGRNDERDRKILRIIGDIFSIILKSGATLYTGERVHGRVFFSAMEFSEELYILHDIAHSIVYGDDRSAYLCFDRNELFQAMPQLREEYPESKITGDPWFRVMRNLDNLDFEKIFPEAARHSDENSGSVMPEKDIPISWESDGQTGKRIAGLETALAAKDAELEQARAALAALREENAALTAELELAQGNIPYTLWLEVCVMRREGKTDNEIAAALYDKGQGLSKSQLGALLYTGKETRPASTTLQYCGTRLLR